ncbi:hypothetical protein Pta02_01700 [Planobispora takensis]|uniref:Uncharacterized protein n=1 Tax=Planobispora takensis TaxID=1367882 RepID=A0A8J3WSP6_9ACTN|nr:hypothetical protein Pta02_01700 [Planobispora takensis]
MGTLRPAVPPRDGQDPPDIRITPTPGPGESSAPPSGRHPDDSPAPPDRRPEESSAPPAPSPEETSAESPAPPAESSEPDQTEAPDPGEDSPTASAPSDDGSVHGDPSLPVFRNPELLKRAREALGLDRNMRYTDAEGVWDLDIAPPGTPACRDYTAAELRGFRSSQSGAASPEGGIPHDSCQWPAFIRWLLVEPAPGEVSNWTKFTGLPERELELVVTDPPRPGADRPRVRDNRPKPDADRPDTIGDPPVQDDRPDTVGDSPAQETDRPDTAESPPVQDEVPATPDEQWPGSGEGPPEPDEGRPDTGGYTGP